MIDRSANLLGAVNAVEEVARDEQDIDILFFAMAEDSIDGPSQVLTAVELASEGSRGASRPCG